MLGIVDTMAQAIALANLEKPTVQWAKKQGCTAFLKGSRVDCDALVKWVEENRDKLRENPPVTKEEADIRLKLARAEKAEHELAVAKRRVISAAEVDEQGVQIGKIFSAKVISAFVVELPPKTAGLGEIEVRTMNKAAATALLADLHNRLTWYKEPEQKD